jgi:hypothetical protein
MKIIISLLVILFFPGIKAQDLIRFTVKTDQIAVNTPVNIELKGLQTNNTQGIPGLYEITKEGEQYIPSQVENGVHPRLWFIIDPSQPGKNREFVLRLEERPAINNPSKITVSKDPWNLKLKYNNKPVLQYRHAEMYPLDSIDPLYKRSGYIHPLWSPGGFKLTRIQPPDHYHHYGIWGPWTKTHIDGREVDFWNLAKGQGTVQFSKFISTFEGEVFSGFEALQEHLDFGAKGEDQVALTELLDVRVWNTEDKVWIIDYTTSLNSPLPDGILFDAYRYGGGLGFRSTEHWNKENCSVLTSENKTRKDADGTSARWCIIKGESDTPSGHSGILFLSHPANRMHPEPMRVWPEDAAGGRGDMFFEFTPIRNEEWKIEPNQKYTLKYRMIVFDGEMNKDEAEKYWKGFAGGVKINLKE